MKKILVLTNIYPAPDLEKENTPVVHYFAREWVEMGYDVIVAHYIYNFPQLYFWCAKVAHNFLKKLFGMAVVRTSKAHELEYELDGVKIKRIPVMKFIPHGKYPKIILKRAVQKTFNYCQQENFCPDVIISHWVNPQLVIMCELQRIFKVPSALVVHLDGTELASYKTETINKLLAHVDCVGFRSDALKRRFLAKFSYAGPSFPCYSGIPKSFMLKDVDKDFSSITKFAYVGTLIERKYPAAIIPALEYSFGNDHSYKMTYVGRGNESKHINEEIQKYNCKDNVVMLGFVPREKVVNVLKESEVFIMISTHETYGLVYLEAMAAGCITIASREEGFDGIIKHGENGFLCDAGNVDELSEIITTIRRMNAKDLKQISDKAIATAKTLTDRNAAKIYIDYIRRLCGLD